MLLGALLSLGKLWCPMVVNPTFAAAFYSTEQ